MNEFEEGVRLIEKICGGGKDNVIALSTIAAEPGADGEPRPCVRDVDALYEDGVFYITTYAKSNKMRQIEMNRQVAFSVPFEGVSGSAVGENRGWVLSPENETLRSKLRKAFADWYDDANNEQDENCVILALRITQATLFIDHGAVRYQLDFTHRSAVQ